MAANLVKILEDVVTDFGPISTDLIDEAALQAWRDAHPDRAILCVQDLVLVMYQKLPDP